MKKALIISEKEENIEKEELKKFIDYADSNNLLLQGEVHCPLALILLEPEELISTIVNIKDIDEILVNNEALIVADILHDGKITEKFHEEGIEIKHIELDIELGEIYKKFSDSNIENVLKHVLFNEVGDIFEPEKIIAIITNDDSQEELRDFVNQIMETKNVGVHLICMNNYMSEMEPMLEKAIGGCEQVIIFDNEVANIEFVESMDKLASKYQLYFEFKDNLDNQDYTFGLRIN